MASVEGRVVGAARRLRAWIGRLPLAGLLVLALLVAGASTAAGVFMYRTYTYVEHDNEFCLSCHLMVDPYERFAQSAHRGLGCKACHQPTFVERSRMALAQVIEQPEEIRTHAEVSNAACASCHIEGNPEQWRIISRSLGHRIHFESDDPSLRGLMCVECHSSSIHEFAATDRTCSQSGCHTDTPIQLGRMQDLTIHCLTCHDFSRPIPDDAPLGIGLAQLQPGRNECLSCHAMRLLVADIPVDEPHDRVCGACHNPHEQATPREAERTCATAGCHARPDTLSPMHQGLAVGVLGNCVTCHSAHTFRVQGSRCLDCHADIFDDPVSTVGATARAHPPLPGAAGLPGPPVPRFASLRPSPQTSQPGNAAPPAAAWHPVVPASLTIARPSAALPRPNAAPHADDASPQAVGRQDPLVFSHRQHRNVECTACHSTERTHGAVTVTSIRDCRSCHHTAPVAADCTRCHQPAQLRAERQTVEQVVRFSVAAPRTRSLGFSHAVHARESCTACHREALTLRADVTCNACHEQHHQPNRECIGCHVQPPARAHTVQAHVGCTGAGCHSPMPSGVAGVPRTRNFCLTCHQTLVNHQPQGNCADCHRLPAPHPRAALRSPADDVALGAHPPIVTYTRVP